MTLTWALSMSATYPLELEAKPTLKVAKHVRKCFVSALTVHGGIGISLYVPIILTRLLVDGNPILASVVTGVAFPFTTWLVRKIAVKWVGKMARENAKEDDARFRQLYGATVKAFSAGKSSCLLSL